MLWGDSRDLSAEEQKDPMSNYLLLRKSLAAKEILFKQKAIMEWLVSGDLNTRFFHIMTKVRYRRNNLEGLLIDGVWIDNPFQL